MIVPEVTLKWYPHPWQSHWLRHLIRVTSISPHRGQATPLGQRRVFQIASAGIIRIETIQKGDKVHGSSS